MYTNSVLTGITEYVDVALRILKRYQLTFSFQKFQIFQIFQKLLGINSATEFIIFILPGKIELKTKNPQT